MKGAIAMRERGSALIVAALFLLVFLGMALALVSLGVGTERDVRSTVFTDHAFYLAEAGINASQHELSLKVDAGKDGLGNVSKAAAGGIYQAVVTPIANEEYNVVSTGTYGGYSARVAVTFYPVFTAMGAMGAIGISQGVPDAIEFKDKLNNNNLHVDGGTVPAITVQDKATYDLVVDSLAEEIDKGKLSATAFTGNPLVPVQTDDGGTIDLPFMNTPSAPIDVPLLEAVRQDLFTNVQTTLIPNATRTISSNKSFNPNNVWGTSTSPEITVLTKDLTPKSNTTITGYGTLIVTGGMNLGPGVSLDWHGDVYLMPTAGDAKFLVNGGALNVTGNVLSIESVKGQGYLILDKSSSTGFSTGVINGALMVLNGPLGKAAAVQVMQGSKLTVNGFVSMTGEKTQILVKDDGTQLIVNGTMQMGALSGGNKTPQLRFDITSTAYFTWNTALVQSALAGISQLLKDRNLSIGSQLFGYGKKAWRPVP